MGERLALMLAMSDTIVVLDKSHLGFLVTAGFLDKFS